METLERDSQLSAAETIGFVTSRLREIAASIVRLKNETHSVILGDRPARKAMAARIAGPVGLTVEPLYHSLQSQRTTWIDRLCVERVLDVGANTGQWATDLRNGGYKGRLRSFEPQRAAFATLRDNASHDPNWFVERCALGATTGSIDLQVTVDSLSSSILSPANDTYDFMALSDPEPVPIRMLEEFASETSGFPTYLKIDVQGYEVEVLRGAGSLLKDCVAVECELSLTPLYNGQALIEDVVGHLRLAGFTPVTFTRGYTDPDNHQVVQVDGVFVRQALLPA